MRRTILDAVTLGALGTLAVVVVLAGNSVAGLDDRISDLINKEARQPMQTLQQDVTTAGGDIVTVTTTRGSDESLTDWVNRHTEAVTAVKGIGG